MRERKSPDPARLMALLWRVPVLKHPRGPRPEWSIDEVVDRAVSAADAEGLAAVTIRRIAKQLGVAPMSVYTYVPGKAELFALMVDAVHRTMERSAPHAPTWRERVTAVAHDNRRLYLRHAWLLEVPPNRPPLGPGTIAKYEYELAAFDGVCLDAVEIDAALGYVLGFVESCAHLSARARTAERDSAQTDSEWWSHYAPQLELVYDPSSYPRATRIGSAAGEHHQGAFDADFAYTFGLARVLDGLEVLIEGRKTSGAS